MVSFARLAILSFCQQKSRHLNSSRKLFFHQKPLSPPSSSTLAFLLSTTTSIVIGTGVGIENYTTAAARCIGSTSCNMSSSTSSDGNTNTNEIINTGYLNAKDAYDLDQQLFSTGYTLEQLMELAGLAVAEAIYDVSPPDDNSTPDSKKKKVLIVCGPGNNGGDGLVAARHLVMFGYETIVVYPKRSSREIHYSKLVKQCEDVGVKVLDEIPESKEGESSAMKFDVIVDAIFGFSFKGEAREPFATIIQKMIELQQLEKVPIVAVDVPSGWNVDEGDVANTGMVPDILVSLTSPKLCSKQFKGRHFVGGRFLPPGLADRYGIEMPPYPGVRQVMEITANTGNTVAPTTISDGIENNDDDWAAQYASYCEEKEKEEFKSSNNNKDKLEANHHNQSNEEEDDDWALQYQNHCTEKEAKLREKEELAKQKSKE